jgi:hypothetical protein
MPLVYEGINSHSNSESRYASERGMYGARASQEVRRLSKARKFSERQA